MNLDDILSDKLLINLNPYGFELILTCCYHHMRISAFDSTTTEILIKIDKSFMI